MKVYVGEVVNKAVNSSEQPVPKSRIAKQIGLSRTQFYKILEEPEMDPFYVIKIGKAIGKDFSKEIAQLKDFEHERILLDDQSVPPGLSLDEMKNEFIMLQRKYIMALEDIRQLQKELREYDKKK